MLKVSIAEVIADLAKAMVGMALEAWAVAVGTVVQRVKAGWQVVRRQSWGTVTDWGDGSLNR